jgi:DNA repair protein RadC
METFGIKAWAEADRPREKLTQKGKHTLTDSELLAILIRSGTREESALELSKKILHSVSNDLTELSKMSVAELSRHKGMGVVKAITVVAALELGRRKREAEASRKINITSSKDVASLFEPLLADLPHEEFWLLMVNRANQIISRQNLSKGGVTGTVVDPKLIFKLAVDCLASGIVLIHNHPSGNNKPSDADIRLTKKIKDAGLLLDISVLDHIIIAGTSYYSFADSGMM